MKASYNGVIADVSGNTLIFTIGSKAGVQVGDVVEITRAVRTVKNPTTGAVLKVITDTPGEAKITNVDKDSSTGKFTGSGTVQVNDTVSSQP